jgi:hypothetical protein
MKLESASSDAIDAVLEIFIRNVTPPGWGIPRRVLLRAWLR